MNGQGGCWQAPAGGRDRSSAGADVLDAGDPYANARQRVIDSGCVLLVLGVLVLAIGFVLLGLLFSDALSSVIKAVNDNAR